MSRAESRAAHLTVALGQASLNRRRQPAASPPAVHQIPGTQVGGCGGPLPLRACWLESPTQTNRPLPPPRHRRAAPRRPDGDALLLQLLPSGAAEVPRDQREPHRWCSDCQLRCRGRWEDPRHDGGRRRVGLCLGCAVAPVKQGRCARRRRFFGRPVGASQRRARCCIACGVGASSALRMQQRARPGVRRGRPGHAREPLLQGLAPAAGPGDAGGGGGGRTRTHAAADAQRSHRTDAAARLWQARRSGDTTWSSWPAWAA